MFFTMLYSVYSCYREKRYISLNHGASSSNSGFSILHILNVFKFYWFTFKEHAKNMDYLMENILKIPFSPKNSMKLIESRVFAMGRSGYTEHRIPANEIALCASSNSGFSFLHILNVFKFYWFTFQEHAKYMDYLMENILKIQFSPKNSIKLFESRVGRSGYTKHRFFLFRH